MAFIEESNSVYFLLPEAMHRKGRDAKSISWRRLGYLFPRNLWKTDVLIGALLTFGTLSLISYFILNYSYRRHQPFKCSQDFGYPMKVTLTDRELTYPFKYLFNAKHTCRGLSEVYLLTLVKSAVGNFSQRYYIRATWGKDARRKNMRLAFLLGYNEEKQILVNYENTVHGDLIQEDFVDSYRNNTYKMAMAYRWISKHCTNAKFIQFVDDDMYINLQNSLEYLHKVEKRRNPFFLYGGFLVNTPIPERNEISKWYISRESYEYECYPPYITGGYILVSKIVAKQFNQIIPYVKKMPFDDVYLGIVAQKLFIHPTHIPQVETVDFNRIESIKCNIAKHGFRTAEAFITAYNLTHVNYLN